MALIDSGKTFDKNSHHNNMKEYNINKDSITYLLRMPSLLHKMVKIKLATENKRLKDVLVSMLEDYIK